MEKSHSTPGRYFAQNDWLRLTANSDQPPHTPGRLFLRRFFLSRRRRRRYRSTVRSSPATIYRGRGSRLSPPPSPPPSESEVYRRRRRRLIVVYTLSDVLPVLFKRPPRQSPDINVTMSVCPDIVYNLRPYGIRDSPRDNGPLSSRFVQGRLDSNIILLMYLSIYIRIDNTTHR